MSLKLRNKLVFMLKFHFKVEIFAKMAKKVCRLIFSTVLKSFLVVVVYSDSTLNLLFKTVLKVEKYLVDREKNELYLEGLWLYTKECS